MIYSCKKSEKINKISAADWLIGTWENKSAQGKLSENWEKLNDSVYIGKSYFIKLKDTLHSESIVLKEIDGDLLYIPTVKGQNNDEPVSFKLTLSTTKQLVFENPKHDYPQKIVYSKINNDSLVATISGLQQGKPTSDNFKMSKKR